MAESGLSLTYTELMNEVSTYLGFGVDYTAISSAKQTQCENIIKKALRRFYNEISWTFLYPTATLSLVANTEDYDAPDDFAGIAGVVTFTNTNEGYWQARVIPEPELLALRQNHQNRTGRPQFVAVRPKTHDGTTGQRHEILVWPKPSASESAYYRKITRQEPLSTNNPYPLGGAEHAETIRAACIAAAELENDDEIGPREQKYQAELGRSMRKDGDLQPRFLGYNGDDSDTMLTPHHRHEFRQRYANNVVTYSP